SQERSSHTLELLSLTGMKPAELFVGKLMSGLLLGSVDLLALFPLLALPFLMGGVPLHVFAGTLVCLPLLLLLSTAIALLVSVLCADDGAASVLALAMGAVLSLGAPLPYALGKALTGSPPFS